MDTSRVVTVQYCDDIRHEIGSKYSLIGCYSDELIVNKLPAVLPKLCAFVLALTPAERPFSRLVVRATLNGEVLAEMEMPIPNLPLQRKASESELGRIGLRAMMVFSPLPLTEPCKLQIITETEDGIIPGSYLNIRERTETDPPIV